MGAGGDKVNLTDVTIVSDVVLEGAGKREVGAA